MYLRRKRPGWKRIKSVAYVLSVNFSIGLLLPNRDCSAYELLRENFNMMERDFTTGCVILAKHRKQHAILYCVNVDGIKELEENTSLDMKIHLRGTVGVNGSQVIIMKQDRPTLIYHANPHSNSTAINVIQITTLRVVLFFRFPLSTINLNGLKRRYAVNTGLKWVMIRSQN